MTTEIPMNNQLTFEPNQYYYCVTDTYFVDGVNRRDVIVVKVEKQSRSGKSVWLKNNSNYCIIKNDEKGKYIKFYDENFYAIDNVYNNNKFTTNFKNVCSKINDDDELRLMLRDDDNFELSDLYFSGLIYDMLNNDDIDIAFIGYIKPTVKDYTFQILETVEEFKEKISDNEYKKVVELLQKVHNFKT